MKCVSKPKEITYIVDGRKLDFHDHVYETKDSYEDELCSREGCPWAIEQVEEKEKTRSELYKEAKAKGWTKHWRKSTLEDLNFFLTKQD